MGFKFNPFTGTLDVVNASSSGGAVDSVTASDSTLTISPTTGAVLAAVNQAFNFAWTGAHTWGGVITIDASAAIQLNVNSNFTVDDGGVVIATGLYSPYLYSTIGAGIIDLGASFTRIADDNGLVIDGGSLTFQILSADVFTHDGITASFLTDLTSTGAISATRFLAGDLTGLDTSVIWAGTSTGQASGRVNSPDDDAYIVITSAQASGTAKSGLVLADHGTFLGSIVVDGTDSDKLKFFTNHPSTPSSLALWFDHSTNVATFEADVNVPDEAYGAGWNGSLEVPTKNAVYDKIQTISGGSFSMTETEIDFGTTPQWGKTFTVTDASVSGASKISAWSSGNVATSRVGNDDEWDMVMYSAKAGTGSFTLTAQAFPGPIVGKRKVYYAIA